MISDSNVFFECNAQVMNTKFLRNKHEVQPLYSIVWLNNWPSITNQNLLQIKNFDKQIAINKKIKLKLNQSMEKMGKNSTLCSEQKSPPLTKDITKNAALNIELNGICPSLYSCSQFLESPNEDTPKIQQLNSCSLTLETGL